MISSGLQHSSRGTGWSSILPVSPVSQIHSPVLGGFISLLGQCFETDSCVADPDNLIMLSKLFFGDSTNWPRLDNFGHIMNRNPLSLYTFKNNTHSKQRPCQLELSHLWPGAQKSIIILTISVWLGWPYLSPQHSVWCKTQNVKCDCVAAIKALSKGTQFVLKKFGLKATVDSN